MSRRARLRPVLSLALSLPLALALAACGSDPTVDGNARFSVRESVEQLHVTHATPGVTIDLLDGGGQKIQSGTTDKLGSYIFRKVPPAAGYTIHAATTPAEVSRHLTVMAAPASQPAQAFYSTQKLTKGFGYIKTRDGTTLSIYVTLPGPVENGPYPTVVDYSGYNPSQPGSPVSNGKYAFLCDQIPTLCDAPTDSSALIAGLFDYATVSVNMRGTGCSGGAYDYFETLQLLDGYDVIETVAAQDWVLNHKVGMTGLSYPGISQLFVAKTNPPSLAAITPLSVIGNSATTLVPGGILNDGFALEWVTRVLNEADPYGQGWEQARVDAGDEQCKENQLLHLQKINNVAEAQDSKFYTPEIIDPINPTAFADQIKVPIFLGGAWQDEQTGPFFVTLLDRFKGSPFVRLNVYNGVHVDGYQPQMLAEWKNFLDLYIARKIPKTRQVIRDLSPQLFGTIFHTMQKFPPDRFADARTYDEALARFNAEPALRVIFESGTSDPMDPGAPGSTVEKRFSQFPPKETVTTRYYLHADGTLAAAMPTEASAGGKFTLDPDAGTRGILQPNGNVWDKLPAYDWKPLSDGKALAWETPALSADTVMVGTGSADLWLSSTVDDADLQVSVTEVRPDGQEMYVQSGWLRASFAALNAASSTELWPDLTYHVSDEKPLVPGTFTQVRVPIAGFAHVFRAGSKVRISVDTPGGTRAEWRFGNKKFAMPAVHTIGLSATHASSIALPTLAGVTIGTPLPACPSLRGQPCRAYAPLKNTPAD